MTDTTDIIVLIDTDSAIKEKRMIAFNAEVDDVPYKFIMSISDFADFGVENAGLDPVASVSVISNALTKLIEDKARKNDLLATTKLAAF